MKLFRKNKDKIRDFSSDIHAVRFEIDGEVLPMETMTRGDLENQIAEVREKADNTKGHVLWLESGIVGELELSFEGKERSVKVKSERLDGFL